MSNGNFWAGAALGALTVGIASAAGRRSRCCNYSFGGFSSFGNYNTFGGFGGFSYGFNNSCYARNAYSSTFNGLCNRHIAYGPSPFETFGVSNRVMSQINLGWYI